MARQGGRVQLEKSNMRLALNIAKMAKQGCSRAGIEETKYLMKSPHSEVRQEKTRGVEFPSHKTLKAVIQTHRAMLCQNQTAGFPPCHNGSAKYQQTRWRRYGTCAPPPEGSRERTPERTPPVPGTPRPPTSTIFVVQPVQIVNLTAGYTYLNTMHPCAEFFGDEETEHDTDFHPDMLTDEGVYTLCGVRMQLTIILKTSAAD